LNTPCPQAKAIELVNLSITLPVASHFYRFAKASAARVRVDTGVSCHAASQQGVIILFKPV